MKCAWRSCKNEFEPIRSTSKFCSHKCKNKQGVQKRREKMKFMAIQYKDNKCFDCQTSFTEYNVYEFHHLDPQQKDFGIGSNGHTRSWDKVKQELDKCVMLCANCHRKRHYKELQPVFEW